MRMKTVCDDHTFRDVANEFLALKKAQKVRERTLSDYKKYLGKFLVQSQNLTFKKILGLIESRPSRLTKVYHGTIITLSSVGRILIP